MEKMGSFSSEYIFNVVKMIMACAVSATTNKQTQGLLELT
jgi:hypothetical protein